MKSPTRHLSNHVLVGLASLCCANGSTVKSLGIFKLQEKFLRRASTGPDFSKTSEKASESQPAAPAGQGLGLEFGVGLG